MKHDNNKTDIDEGQDVTKSSLPNRRSVRLKNYDYSLDGAYFITICTQDKKSLFGNIIAGKMSLNQFGQIIEQEWEKTEKIRKEITLGEYVIMPNHFHAIAWIRKNPSYLEPVSNEIDTTITKTRGSKSGSISSLIIGFKASVTKQINEIRGTHGEKIWQRGFWEHVIRGEDDLCNIRHYIKDNPKHWEEDSLYIYIFKHNK